MSIIIYRLPEVIKRTGLSRSAIYKRICEGTFPKQIKLGRGARAAGWPSDEVDQWIAMQVQAERQGE